MDQEDIRWIKSSYSGGSGTECVEVAASAANVAVRDSKVPHGPRLALGPSAWAGFVTAIRQAHLK
ncbi:DUF397 domain-containing protein [Streptomyces lunaelactis]|uniref:DUF397 domain-containing protein n=1 Tax=Streptomyces lunaelactis TaxID=1535768 RepID=UPI001585023B|nr:DUF397 domain-containing protein [Streptomyces lunaelactis]NUL03672.1 DUF397 domain-containing protein [Streptomyces lunaelactis]